MKKTGLTMLFALACSMMPVTAQNYVLTSVAEQGSTRLNATDNVYFGTAAGEQSVAVNTNIAFTATADADWCSVEANEKAVAITVKENTEAANRTATITLTGKDALRKVITVNQNGTDAEKYPTFAVISDTHFGNNRGEGPMVKVPRTLKSLTAKGKLDAIVVVGDLTDSGQPAQYDQFVSVFTNEDNFINPVDTFLFMMGNHDNYNGSTGFSNYQGKLKNFYDGENYPMDQYVVIKGYPFITISVRGGSNNDDTNPGDGVKSFPQDVCDRLEAWLEQAATECPGKPIFVFTHVPPKYTCYSTWPGEGDGTTWPTWGMQVINPILNKYPQVVAFGGHSHYPLTDPRSIHQGVNPNSDKNNYYTGVGTGSVTYSEIHSPSVDWSDRIHPNYFEHITEGIIVDVLPDGNVELRRYDTRLDEEIQPENRWLLKAPFDGSMFEYADVRDRFDNVDNKPMRTGLPAPVFAEDAKIELTSAGPTVNLTFPVATDNEGVFRYKVQIFNDKGFAVKNNWIFSEFYRNSDAPKTFSASFSGLEIGKEHTAVIEAYDSYENVSEKLTYTYIQGAVGEAEIPARLAQWTFDESNDTLVADEGDIEMRPGKISSSTVSAKKTLSAAGMSYTEGPSEENGALFVPKGSSLRIMTKKMTSYTLMLDVKIPDYKFRALLQTNRLNDDDADFFINQSGGIGVGDMGYGGKMELNEWHRIVISTKEGRPSIYLDGGKVCEATAANDRWIIGTNSGYLFTDDNGETADIYVAEIGLWNIALDETQVGSLGGYSRPMQASMTVTETSFDLTNEKEFNLNVSANIEPKFTTPEWVHLHRPTPSIGTFTYIFFVDPLPDNLTERSGELIVAAPEGSGIEPVVIPLTQTQVNTDPTVPTVDGAWTFDNADDLLGNSGEAKYTITSGKMNGTAMELAASGIKQVTGPAPDNKAILIPKETMLYLKFTESTSTDKKKNYTLMFDIRESSFNFEALLQPNLQNNTDAMFFINQSGQIGHYASGNWGYGGQVKANTWHRIVITVKNGVPNAYLDGELVTPGKNGFNGAWELDPTGCFLFADNDGERLVPEVAEIRYWDKALTALQVGTLGKVTVVDTPQEPIEIPARTAEWNFDNAEDLYTNAVGGDIKLTPYKFVGNDTAPVLFAEGEETGITKTDKGIAIPKTTSLFMNLNEEADLTSYTIVYDLKVADAVNFTSLYQTDLENDDDDGELFIAKNMLGISRANLLYGGKIEANKWHRIAAVVTDKVISTYIDGVHVGTSTAHDSWVIRKEGVFFFLDDNNESTDVEVGGLQFWKQSLSNEEIKTLGAAE